MQSAQWGGSELATSVICGLAAATGALVGVVNGFSRDGSIVSKVLVGLLQGAGGAILFGVAAVLVVVVVSLVWVLASKVAARSWRAMRGGLR